MVGIIGIAIELFSPGLIIPGTLGVVSFLLGAFGTSQLPVTAVGIALLVVGIAMIIAEAHLPTNGIVGAIGAVALVASGLLLFDTGSDFDVSTPVVIGAAIVTARTARLRGQKGGRGQSQPGAHRVGGAAGRGGRRARPASARWDRSSSRARCGRRRSPTAAPRPRPNGCASAALESESRRSKG